MNYPFTKFNCTNCRGYCYLFLASNRRKCVFFKSYCDLTVVSVISCEELRSLSVRNPTFGYKNEKFILNIAVLCPYLSCTLTLVYCTNSPPYGISVMRRFPSASLISSTLPLVVSTMHPGSMQNNSITM